MKRMIHFSLETFQEIGGIAILVVAGFVIQWWTLPGAVLFCLGLVLLCVTVIEENIGGKRL